MPLTSYCLHPAHLFWLCPWVRFPPRLSQQPAPCPLLLSLPIDPGLLARALSWTPFFSTICLPKTSAGQHHTNPAHPKHPRLDSASPPGQTHSSCHLRSLCELCTLTQSHKGHPGFTPASVLGLTCLLSPYIQLHQPYTWPKLVPSHFCAGPAFT